MISPNGFLPILRKFGVDNIFHRDFSPAFKIVLETVCVVELILNFRNFRYFHYFNSQFCNRRPKYGHIPYQRCQINVNQRFVFQFSQNLVLTVSPSFSVAISDRRFEPKTLVCNPIQSNKLKKKNLSI